MQKWEPTFQILDATTLYRWQTSGMRHSRERHEVCHRKIACRGGRQNWREAAGYVQERRRVALQHPDERLRHDPAADRSQLVPATEHCCLAKNVVPERRLGEQNSAAASSGASPRSRASPDVSCVAVMGAIPKNLPCPGRSADPSARPLLRFRVARIAIIPVNPGSDSRPLAMKLSIFLALLCTRHRNDPCRRTR